MDMRTEELLARVDHTLLKPEAGWNDIRQICDDAVYFHTASVCIPPCYAARAKEYLGDSMKVCTVIGFPNGYNAAAVKVFEAEQAVRDGADEIDMVINVGWLKAGEDRNVLDEITRIRSACPDQILKVIIETCLLTEEEKIRACRLVTEAGADYIKTSTGFSTGGATMDDVKHMRANVGPEVKIKAAGGIRSLEDAEALVAAGADRLGTSRIVQIVKQQQ